MLSKKIIINIASSGGRSHLLDLAKELDNLGYEVNFYSYVPDSRAAKFGLKKSINKSYSILFIPFYLLFKLTNKADWTLYLFHRFFDYYVSLIMKPCDIFIGHSPMHVKSLKVAKIRFNAKIILERGTSHVLEQINALKENPNLRGKVVMKRMFIEKDLKGYNLADIISVGSDHVKKSFTKHGFDESKIFVNNYGVSLTQFTPTEFDKNHNFDIIFVGQWCYRKGCDLLANVCKSEGFTLLHVGPIVDLEFPTGFNFVSKGIVDQSKLVEYYKMAKIFVLPSREEGLALVQAQAIACGLPIVCSKYTGGRDLKKYVDFPEYIIEINSLKLEDLKDSIIAGLNIASNQFGIRKYINNENYGNLSWKEYGKRYSRMIEKLTSGN